MINLQHYDSLEPAQPIEIDWVVLDLQMKLKTNLSWLSHSYGKAYRIDKQGTEKRFILPEVYIGNTDGKYSLMPVTPDNDKKGIVFFVIDKEKQLTNDINSQNFLSWNVGIVFWANLEFINESFAKNQDYTQNLIKEVRDILTNEIIGSGYNLSISEVAREHNEIFREFLLQDRRYVIMPFTAFRFNVTITLKEECGLNLDRQAAILNNVTDFEIKNYILPTLDFTTDDFLSLSEQQKADLLTRLTV